MKKAHHRAFTESLPFACAAESSGSQTSICKSSQVVSDSICRKGTENYYLRSSGSKYRCQTHTTTRGGVGGVGCVDVDALEHAQHMQEDVGPPRLCVTASNSVHYKTTYL